jgi:tetraacyldisaccharide 4'-kinase
VVLLLGVARPDLVSRSVEGLGARIVGLHAHPDHHAFTSDELVAAHRDAEANGALLVTTEKDAERLPAKSAHVLVLEVEVLSGELPLPRR